MFPWEQAIGVVGGVIDQAWYSEQERARDQLLADQTEAQKQAARAQQQTALAMLQAEQQRGQTLKFLGILGAGIVGVGLLVYATR